MRMRTSTSFKSIMIAALGAAASVANAGTLTVDQNHPDCDDTVGQPYCSIAAAIAAAQPGDTINVESGIYFEFDLVVAQPDVRLKGKDGAILDGGCAPASGIVVAASGVEVRGFTIQHVQTGISVGPGAAGVVIRDNCIESVEFGIVLDGAIHASVRENELRGGAGCNPTFGGEVGILAEGGSANEFIENHVEGFDDSGFEIDDEDDVLCKNVSIGNGDGYNVDGDDNQFIENLAASNADDGFDIDGSDNVFEENEACENGDNGIDVDGDENLFEGNRSRENADRGFEVDGDENVFRKNRSENNGNDGFRVRGDENELDRNRSMENGQDGYDIPGDANRLVKNHATRNDDEGFEVDGSGNELEKNRAKENDSDGFKLDGSGSDLNVLVQNMSLRNGGDGFDVEGDENVLEGNRAVGNDDTGFDVEGTMNAFSWSQSIENGAYGLEDSTGPDAASVLNSYVETTCAANALGSSDPPGLCGP